MTPTHGRPKMRATCSAAAVKISGMGAPRATSNETWRSAASSVVSTRSRTGDPMFTVSLRAHGLPPVEGDCPVELRRTDEAVREREEHEFGARVEIELAHDVSAVRVDGPYRDVQLLADLLIRVTERKELEDVSFAFG